ncbi:hypothetical protein OCS65_28405 (plasmid) [Rhodococcus aetherivorans]|uniref:Uncharacterized protein n=1 Tax=Rhodococcus aetherivorans TaxID=191292 RepID=A0AA46SGU3_9NOCA|nr:hypothetical protein [Rhodococcus aetherivorans]MDV6297396.1 hypothetical protein [Rhodococcus aetherivorans]UYF97146.1 hypothetical protein OCS65_28405 [Rhodococcus aetherivorans]
MGERIGTSATAARGKVRARSLRARVRSANSTIASSCVALGCAVGGLVGGQAAVGLTSILVVVPTAESNARTGPSGLIVYATAS